MGNIDLAWRLFKESFTVLAAEEELLVFPVLSGVSALALGASFFFPLYREGVFEALRHHHKAPLSAYAMIFAWHYLNFFVGIFFNSALMGCANIRLSGGKPTVSAGLQIALDRIGRIAAWAFVATTVGLVLNSLRERGNILLNAAASGASVAWTLVTYLIVPVLLFEDSGVFNAVSRSKELFRSHWGEQVAGSFGMGLLSFLLSLPAFALAALCWRWDPVAGIIFAAVYLLILVAVFSAVKGIFTVALYRYATSGTAPTGFSADVIDGMLGGRRRILDNPSWDRP
jgi:uncharacterized membrane protein YobD (UPF0266 family)